MFTTRDSVSVRWYGHPPPCPQAQAPARPPGLYATYRGIGKHYDKLLKLDIGPVTVSPVNNMTIYTILIINLPWTTAVLVDFRGSFRDSFLKSYMYVRSRFKSTWCRVHSPAFTDMITWQIIPRRSKMHSRADEDTAQRKNTRNSGERARHSRKRHGIAEKCLAESKKCLAEQIKARNSRKMLGTAEKMLSIE